MDVSEGFIIQDIEGLDPVKATLVSSSFANLDGEQYQSARREKRNLLFTLGLEPDYVSQSVKALRNRLYGHFMPKSNVNFRFFSDDFPTVDISGRVESFEAPLFAKEPEAKLSLLCFNPDFYDADPILFSGNTVANATEATINYDGTVESGIAFRIMVNRPIIGFTIFNRSVDNSIRALEFLAPLQAGDVIEINTTSGSKGATLIRAGIATSILYGISPYSSWLEMFPGPNYIRVVVSGAPIPYTIEFTTKYGGL
jgi:hypothetical protein